MQPLWRLCSYHSHIQNPNQEQDDDRQPQNHWINLQVTERQHPHSVQER